MEYCERAMEVARPTGPPPMIAMGIRMGAEDGLEVEAGVGAMAFFWILDFIIIYVDGTSCM